MNKIAIVLGNGFDLDLGLFTKYSDFANPRNREWNDYCVMRGTIIKKILRTELIDHMDYARKYENWFDIEEELFKFVKSHANPTSAQIGLIRSQYDALVEGLRMYICRVAVPKNKKEGSLAEAILNKLNSIPNPVVLYTFNYTDCFGICGIERKENIRMTHIHGSLSYEMQLGCRAYDGSPNNMQLAFMYKDTCYLQKEILRQNLSTATEVIIFGHSLNQMDFCYFEDFFGDIQSGKQTCEHLTIICKDVKSEESIRQNLNKNVCIPEVERHVEMNFIYTDLWNSGDTTTLKAYEDFCKRIG